ncbi:MULTISPECIES: hypothetical protein [Streptomyces]|uniref:hypothetical protein n=1 Tax=Streptomyces TaxID=1883 RepID=UPI00093B0CC6|nr:MULTISPECIES: hypothetical protein [Streptomyces]MBX9421274.1 hypothetical protein [Streptomyces lateritius]OKJ63919.1 hypothetical protein AMK29_17525 [Streptomyces sp. CB02261]
MTELSRTYVDACLRGDGGLARAVSRAELPPAFEEAWRSRLLPRPWFVAASETAAFARDLEGLFDLLVSLPARLFDGDRDRYAAEIGIGPELAAVLRRGGSGVPTAFGRADAYHDGSSYKVLEFNLGSEVGGVDMAVFNQGLLRVPEFAAFAREHRLDHVDIAARMAAVLRARAAPALSGAAEPVIGLIEGRGGIGPYGRLMRATVEAMAEQGLDLRIGEIGDVRARPDGKLTLDGTPLDLVLRNFGASQLLDDPGGPDVAEPFLRAHDAGRTVLFTSLESGLYANKSALALLTDPRWSGAFDAGERALVDRVLPWSRTLHPSGPAGLVDLCRERRERLILKPGAGYGGLDTFVGWECTDARWSEALGVAAERGGYVAQERVVPRPEPVYDPATGSVDDWIAAVGIFLTDDGYAGAHARANRADGGAIVGMSSNPDTRMVGVFAHP